MQIESNYEINVAKLRNQDKIYPPVYTHYAKIELGGCSKADALYKYEELVNLFPKDTFKLSLTRVTCSGEYIKGE